MTLSSNNNKYFSPYNKDEIIDSNGDGYFEPFTSWHTATGQDGNSTCKTDALAAGENRAVVLQ